MQLPDLVGLDILVGLTFFDAEGEGLRQEQFHGLIDEADKNSTSILPSDGSKRRPIPTYLAAIRPAPGGSYRLASTGQVVTNPFLLVSWMFTEGRDQQGNTYYDAMPNHAPLFQSRVPSEWELSYESNEKRIRRTIEVFGDEYIGRTLLLCLNYLETDCKPRRQEQVVGTIMVVDFDEGIVVSCEPEGRMFVLPGDPSRIERAPPAEYRLRSTGQVVTKPDYIATFTTTQPD
jgi:hypothetical protein